jgi:uncharacterized protein (DUF2267 family)
MKAPRYLLVGGALAGVALTASTVRARLTKTGRRTRRQLERRGRYAIGRIQGAMARRCAWCERLDLDDSVLTDRIRSSLGGLTNELDVPHVHITVERRVALLHGDVGSEHDADALVAATQAVPGVLEVISHLHIGLLAGDTRPSAGAGGTSDALAELVAVARAHGGGGETAHAAVASVLAAFAAVLPDGERAHVAAHLPHDAAALLQPIKQPRATRIRHVDELYAAVAKTGSISVEHVPFVVDAVIAALRNMVPDETADVTAVLPEEIRALWNTERTTTPQKSE